MPHTTAHDDTILIRKPDGTFVTVGVADASQQAIIETPQTKPQAPAPKDLPVESDLTAPTSTPAVDKPMTQQHKQQSATHSKSAVIDWDHEVATVIASLQLTVNDQQLLGRLRSIILSRLRDIRDLLQTKEAITKNVQSGGLGLSEVEAAEVLNSIEHRYKAIHAHQAEASASIPHRDVEDVYAAAAELDALSESDLPTPVGDNYKNLLAGYLNKEAVVTSPPDAVQVPATASAQQQEPAQFDKPPVVQTASPTKPPQQKKRNAQPPPPPEPVTPSMQDVKTKRRLMSPVDELQQMRLSDFRRLGSTTNDRLKKVTEVLEELGDESFSQRVEGIKAWRSSPLYQAYIAVGDSSLGSGKAIVDMIKDMQSQGKDTFTLDEFEQITDFNKSLRY